MIYDNGTFSTSYEQKKTNKNPTCFYKKIIYVCSEFALWEPQINVKTLQQRNCIKFSSSLNYRLLLYLYGNWKQKHPLH